MWLRRIFTGLNAYAREGRGEMKAENSDLSTHFKTLKILKTYKWNSNKVGGMKLGAEIKKRKHAYNRKHQQTKIKFTENTNKINKLLEETSQEQKRDGINY